MQVTFLEQFMQYKESPETALICGDISLSYAQLYQRCQALAAKLRSRGIGLTSTEPEYYDIFEPQAAEHPPWVILISKRSADAVIGAIATFMAGGAFVLIGEDAPEAYINYILEDTAAAIVLRNADFFDLDVENSAFQPDIMPTETQIACAVFTSGSTGRPKGAVLEHRTLNQMITWQTEYMKPAGHTAAAAYAPFSFIASLWELFWPLAGGHTLHILTEDLRHDLSALAQYIEDNQISFLFLPPNVAEVFTRTYQGNALKFLRVAGGRLHSCGDPRGRYKILYSLGMSENGGCVTFYPIDREIVKDIPIGRAWHRTRIYLEGDQGEMAVSGPSLFRGYLARKEETMARLVTNPYSVEPGYEKMYLSGDLAWENENGEFIHMGRNDWTVKIRDMKVNLQQVEAALARNEEIVECCVTAQSINGETTLMAWIVSPQPTDPLTDLGASLQAFLGFYLPEYMIPSIFMALDHLPRNLNGKVDRSKLIYQESAPEGIPEYNCPAYADQWEEKFAVLFRDILRLPKAVKGDDNFFRLGGNSLKLMQLQAETARKLSLSIPYSALFANPTPSMLAGLVRNQESPGESPIPISQWQQMYPLSPSMRQMWLLWRTGQDEGRYTVSIKCTFSGELDRPKLTAAFQQLLQRNSILRSCFIQQSGEIFQVIKEKIEVLLAPSPRLKFDLTAAPLFDITLRPRELIFTTHHIIADAVGLGILMEDFWTLYNGSVPATSAQVHDITLWQINNPAVSNDSFWQHMFRDGVPVLTLPALEKPPVRRAASAVHTVFFNDQEHKHLAAYAARHNVTLFQLFLAAYGFMLAKLADTEKVVVGVPFFGRNHPDMVRTIGMFVKTLPLMLDISGRDFESFLNDTGERFTALWEHQETSLEYLSELIKPPRLSSGKLFYDVMINYIPLPQPLPDVPGLHPQIVRGTYPGALFDLVLDLREEENGISAVFTYADQLFSGAMIEQWGTAFKELLLSHEWIIVPSCDISPVQEETHENKQNCDPLALKELMDVWKETLEKNEVSPSDDFFLSGGTSLAAIRMEAALFERGWLLSATDIFRHPKLTDMAGCLSPADDIDWEDY